MGPALSRWLGVAAAVPGRSHVVAGSPCQDVAAVSHHGGVTCAVLADGAGSSRHADRGAQIVVDAVGSLLGRHLESLLTATDQDVRARILGEVNARIELAADTERAHPSDFAATLLFVATKGDRYLAGQLGDGLLVRETGSAPLFEATRGAHLNETVFVTSSAAAEALTVARGALDADEGFLLASDGAAESLLDRRAPAIAPAVRSMLGWLERVPAATAERALAKNLDMVFRERTSDDCSVALLRRVTLSRQALVERERVFRLAFLECRSERGFRTRLEVLDNEDLDLDALAARCGKSRTTVAAHRAALRAMLQTHSAMRHASSL